MSEKPTLDNFETYKSMARNSVGAELFRSLFIVTENGPFDVLYNGEKSGAFFVSSVLTLFEKIEKTHATVKSTIEDLEKSEWVIAEEAQEGDVIIWALKEFEDGSKHKHIGICTGSDTAVCTSLTTGTVVEVDLNESQDRPIEAIYRCNSW